MPPLAGFTVLIARAAEQAAPLAGPLQALGARTLTQPILTFGPAPDPERLRAALRRLADFDGLVFVSQAGVRFTLQALAELGVSPAALAGKKLAAIGPATAAALHAAGLPGALLPAEFTSEGLAATLREQVRGQRLLLLRADRGRDVLPRLLGEVAVVEEVACYRQVEATALEPAVAQALRRGEIDFALLFSAAGAKALVRLMEAELPAGMRRPELIALSPITAAGLAGTGWNATAVAEQATAEGMVKAARTRAAAQGGSSRSVSQHR